MIPCFRTLVIVTVLSLGLALSPAPAVSQELVANQDTSQTVTVSGVSLQNGAISGSLVNKSPRLLRDVRLLIRLTWFWKNERHPGDDSPGRSDYFTVTEEIPPGGSTSFTYRPSPPLPQRDDGHFEAAAQVVGFTEIGE